MQIQAPIDRVRVHHRGATVTRKVSIESSADTLTIVGLPLCMVDSSVRARVVNSASHVAATVGVSLHVRSPEAVAAPPDAALREAERQRTRLTSAIEALDQQRALFEMIPVLPRAENIAGQAPQSSPFAARVAQAQFVTDQIAAWDAEVARLKAELRTADESVRAAQAALAAYSTATSMDAAPITKAVAVQIQGDQAGPIDLELEYRVPGARWAPQYQVRLDADGAGAELVLRAAVAQATGEDWQGVKLSLSTASPLRATARPILNALRIGEVQPSPPGPQLRSPPRGADGLFTAYDHARRRAPNAALTSKPERLSRLDPPSVYPLDLMVFGAPGGGGMMVGGAAADDGAYAAEVMVAAPRAMAAAPSPPSAPAALGRRVRSAAAPKRKKSAPAPKSVAKRAGPPTDYADLALAGPGEKARGRLTRIDVAQRYINGLNHSGRRLDISPTDRVAAAVQRAERIGAVPQGALDVRQAAGNLDYIYLADARIDVAGDGGWHTIALGVRRATCQTRYVAVPRLDPNVYRIATLHNPLAAPLLPGDAEVYVDGEYVLSAPVPFVAGESVIELGLGVEQRLRCARNTGFEEQRSAEAVVAMTDLVHRIEIAVRNGLRRDADIEVRERIPQAAEGAEVVVEERAIEPAWSPYTQRERGVTLQGGRRWRVTVPAGEEARLSAEYAVRIYAKNALAGGNRREA